MPIVSLALPLLNYRHMLTQNEGSFFTCSQSFKNLLIKDL